MRALPTDLRQPPRVRDPPRMIGNHDGSEKSQPLGKTSAPVFAG
jgi:hypothetical protein